MPTLADINRQKREYASSGRADIGETPALYALLDAQAGSNLPPGIGGAAGSPDATGGAVPSSLAALGSSGGGAGGSGATGAADTGLTGPGLDGYGGGIYDFLKSIEGGQAGEPGGLDRGLNPAPEGYTDLSGVPGELLNYAGYLPGGLGFLAGAVQAGTRAANASVLDDQLEGLGFSGGLSTLQQIGAALGLNEYGQGSSTSKLAGSAAAQRDALTGGQSFRSETGLGGTYKTSPSGPVSRSPNRSVGDRDNDRDRGGPQGNSGDIRDSGSF